MATTANDVFDGLTKAIIDRLEQADENGWRAPWHFTGTAAIFHPRNAQTLNAYRGVNTLALWIAAEDNEYTSGWWATYKQWAALGAQVRKGESATFGIKWVESKATRAAREAAEDGAEPGEQSLFRPRVVPFTFGLFNAEQVDGWEPPAEAEGPEVIDSAERFFTTIGATVQEAPKAFYRPSGDFIGIPPLASFTDAARYYSILAHEHTHWTGAKHRLDRDLSGRFGSESYAAEELVAELGAAFLCAQLGIDNEPREDHADYIKNWLTVLRDDHKAVLTASQLAQAAVGYLTDHTEQEVAA